MNTLQALQAQAAAYFASPRAERIALEPRVSSLFPLHLVPADEQVAWHHYWRFVDGAFDDHAIAGWRFVMDGRGRSAVEAGRRALKDKQQLRIAIAAERKAS